MEVKGRGEEERGITVGGEFHSVLAETILWNRQPNSVSIFLHRNTENYMS